jgi:hypothetical protein
MEVLYGWLEQQMGMQFWKANGARQELLHSYTDSLESNFSQSLLCLLDDRPVCQMDISRAPYNEVFMHLDAEEGDHALWMIMSPYATVRNAYGNIVEAALEYFFSFETTSRIITYLPAYDEWSGHLLMNAGFKYLDTEKMLTVVVNLYEYRRNKNKK